MCGGQELICRCTPARCSLLRNRAAKNIVAAELADECAVQVAYCIGMPDPVSIMLKRPVYRKTAAFGHFGRRDVEFSGERVDAVDELLSQL
jgi:S-adenosylmethionine synthetase